MTNPSPPDPELYVPNATNTFSYRRIAVSYFVVVALSVLTTAFWLNRASCRTTGDCLLTAVVMTLVISSPLVVWLAWRWGQWHMQQATLMTTWLEGEFRRQVSLAGLERTRLSTVLQQMPDGVLLTNDVGQIQLLNSAARRLLQVTEGDALGRSFAEVAYHHELIDLWQKSRADQTEESITLEMMRFGLFLQAIISPIRADVGTGSLIILQDLTRIRRLETIRRDFISNVSHELLTPIAAMRALVETLQDGAIDDPVMSQKFLGRAQIEVDTITQIVNELLVLSRIESGQVSLRLKPIRVMDVVLRPMEHLQGPAARQEIDLVLDLPAGLPYIWADSDQINTVITNLVHNAIKYTPTSGKVTLSAKVKRSFVLPDSDLEQPMVVLSVKDTGIGISQDDLPRVFERFYKGDRSRQRIKADGTGLGLAIAKHIVQAHAGHIWVKSKEWKGSKFYIALPIVTDEEVQKFVHEQQNEGGLPAD